MNATMKITCPDYDFESVEDAVKTMGGEEVVVEMINRYMSTQRMAKKYRQNKSMRDKELKEKYEAAVKAGLIK